MFDCEMRGIGRPMQTATNSNGLSIINFGMETATVFIVGHVNQISRGALLLVSDMPMVPEGVKTEVSDQFVSKTYAQLHLQIGIEAMSEIDEKGEAIKHFRY